MIKDLDILLGYLLLVVYIIFPLLTSCIWFLEEHLIQLLHKLVILYILIFHFFLFLLIKGGRRFLLVLLLQDRLYFSNRLNLFDFLDIFLFIISIILIKVFLDLLELIS